MKMTTYFFVFCFGVFAPVFVFADSFIGPEFNTETAAYTIVDVDSGDVLLGKNAYEIRSIASLTKLMTAMVALDEGFDFTGNVMYARERHYAYRNYMGLQDGDVIENRDLWAAMLVGSMNVPTRMVVDSLGIGEEEFIAKMNFKARDLGMQAVFVDVTGLDPQNMSNAVSVAKMVAAAQTYEQIVRYSQLDSYEFNETVSVDERYHHQFVHTNVMKRRSNHLAIGVSKSGFLNEAGPCLAFVTRIGDKDLVVVTLGEGSWVHRHKEGERLVQWWDNLSLAQKSRASVFLVKYPNDPYVFEVTDQGLVWVPDENVFLSRGYRWGDINEIQFGDRIRLGDTFVL